MRFKSRQAMRFNKFKPKNHYQKTKKPLKSSQE